MAADDSDGGSDARLADVFLAADDYTIEATTAANEAVGAYRLRVEGDFAARAPGQPASTDARVGQRISCTCIPLAAALPADCAVSALHHGFAWGRGVRYDHKSSTRDLNWRGCQTRL